MPDRFVEIRRNHRHLDKTEAAKTRYELDPTQQDSATLPGASLTTIRKWERGTGEPSGAAKTLLAVARLHPEAEALAVGK